MCENVECPVCGHEVIGLVECDWCGEPMCTSCDFEHSSGGCDTPPPEDE